MEETRANAYRVVLAQGLLHLKWDLACLIGGVVWSRPWSALQQMRSARQAALRVCAFHNLAIFSTCEFSGFDEDVFWAGIEHFQHD